MSDHISGPRALAEPIADITDVYAFPSPERPGCLALVMNTLPFAPAAGRFSDGLVYRFRLRPAGEDLVQRRVRALKTPEWVIDCVFDTGDETGTQIGYCTSPMERSPGSSSTNRRRNTRQADCACSRVRVGTRSSWTLRPGFEPLPSSGSRSPIRGRSSWMARTCWAWWSSAEAPPRETCHGGSDVDDHTARRRRASPARVATTSRGHEPAGRL